MSYLPHIAFSELITINLRLFYMILVRPSFIILSFSTLFLTIFLFLKQLRNLRKEALVCLNCLKYLIFGVCERYFTLELSSAFVISQVELEVKLRWMWNYPTYSSLYQMLELKGVKDYKKKLHH